MTVTCPTRPRLLEAVSRAMPWHERCHYRAGAFVVSGARPMNAGRAVLIDIAARLAIVGAGLNPPLLQPMVIFIAAE
jgi:hypothetical protein